MANSPKDTNAERRKLVTEEVTRQMEPLKKAVEAVSQQNKEQSTMLLMQVKSVEDLDRWTKKLWSNGSGGPPGFLEIAREEDEKWKEQVFKALSKIEAEKYREEGEKRLLAEQEQQQDRRLGRWKTYAAFFATFCGAWLWTILRPLFHSIVGYLEKAIK